MSTALSYELHKLVARLDRAADALLRRTEDISYSRFLALFGVAESGGSQRELAEWLGQTEASTSRMVARLAHDGLLSVTTVAGSGNRRLLRLSNAGEDLVQRCSDVLESAFQDLVARSGVPAATYQRHTRRLLDELDAGRQAAAAAIPALT